MSFTGSPKMGVGYSNFDKKLLFMTAAF